MKMSDIDDSRYAGPDLLKIPIIPRNKKEMQRQSKTKEMELTIGEAGNAKGTAIVAAVQLIGQGLEQIGIWNLEGYMKDATRQSLTAITEITSILQNGINTGKISSQYLNNTSLSKLGNYLLYGAEITKYETINGTGQIVEDKELTQIANNLWKSYQTTKAVERIQKNAKDSERQKPDNTGRNNGAGF